MDVTRNSTNIRLIEPMKRTREVPLYLPDCKLVLVQLHFRD